MRRFEGALARELDFGELPSAGTGSGRGQAGLRLAPSTGRLMGPDKYQTLERRRRAAQIRARHLLELMETE